MYDSIGGFSKDAQYEAVRASIPLAMWTLDRVVRALIEYYDATDAETKRIVLLERCTGRSDQKEKMIQYP